MRLRRRLYCLAVFVFMIGGGTVALAQLRDHTPRPPRAVVTEESAFVLGEPTMLAGPEILDVAPAPDGPFALIVRLVPRDPAAAVGDTPRGVVTDGTAELLLWNRKTGRVTPVWEGSTDASHSLYLGQVTWMAGAGAAVLPVVRTDKTRQGEPGAQKGVLLYASVRAARARIIADIDDELPLETGHIAPFVVLEKVVPRERWHTGARPTLRVVRGDGSVGPPVRVEQRGYLYTGLSASGAPAVFCTSLDGRDDKTGQMRHAHHTISLSDGSATRVTEPPNTPPPAATMKGRIEALPVRLSGGEASLSHNGGAERMRAVFLERSDLPRPLEHGERWPEPTARAKPAVTPAPDARTLVATDADPVTLLPDGSAALYRSASGALWAVPLQRQEPTVFLSERRELQKAVTIGNARQIGIALIGYVQDYDETFPRPESDVAADVSPYVKNPDVFRNPATGAPGFTYVHPGVTHIGDVEVPKATVLAYLAGPGGRAVIYADGHVQWEEQ